MNKNIVSAFTAMGQMFLKSVMENAVQKVEAKVNREQDHVISERDLYPAFKIKGREEVYQDIPTLVNRSGQTPNINNVNLVVVLDTSGTYRTSEVATPQREETLTEARVQPYHLNQAILSLLGDRPEKPAVLTSTTGTGSAVEYPTEGASELTGGASNESNTPNPTDSANSNPQSKGLVESAVTGVKNIIDHATSIEKYHKVYVLIEKVDTSKSIDEEGSVNRFNKTMINTAVLDSSLVTRVHIYQDKKYTLTVTAEEFLNHLLTLSVSNKVNIHSIRTINTIVGEYEPDNKWVE